jgi:hypothetical protein
VKPLALHVGDAQDIADNPEVASMYLGKTGHNA